MILSGPRRKLVLAIHLTVSIGWIGAVFAYVALGVAARNGTDLVTVRGAWVAMELIGWYVLLPLAIGSLLTGLVMALGTRWGLIRYYWVLISFALTALVTVVLLLHLPDVSATADTARDAEGATLAGLGGDLFHSLLGLMVLVLILVLNIYKPPGLTRYGWRKQAARP
jgi:hypothetical protein